MHRTSRIRKSCALAVVAILTATQLLMPVCGMAETTASGSVTHDAAASHGAGAAAPGHQEAAASHGAMAAASAHEGVGHAQSDMAHGAPSGEHESHESGGHHGDSESGASDCVGTSSCGAVALKVASDAHVSSEIARVSSRPATAQKVVSATLSLLRRPPRSL